jgi:hypothetical protein
VEGRAEEEIWRRPSREEWRLEPQERMTMSKMVVIAKGRWMIHRERCALNYGQKRRPDMDRMRERMGEELDRVKELDEEWARAKVEGEEEKKEEAQVEVEEGEEQERPKKKSRLQEKKEQKRREEEERIKEEREMRQRENRERDEENKQ